MTVWYHQSTILKCKIALRIAGLIAICVAIITTLFLNSASFAAPGINQTLSFQGRLLTATGAVVADGYYNIQFKIYKGGTDSGGGTEQWTESYVNNNATAGVNVKNGYFSVNLGSRNAFANLVDWNDDTLYLSMNIAGSSPSCSNFASCNPDGEMTPMKRLTAVPFALNAARLGGKTADDLIQNSTSLQTGNFNISGTGTAGSLQSASIDTASAGALTIGGTNATSITMADDVTIAAGKSLTLTGGSTASRPSSPSEGTLWFDTELKKLIIYADGKWSPIGGSNKTATKIVAASNSPADIKNSADYIANGTSDQTEINAALTAAAGGKVYLAEGTYTINASISIPNNTTLTGPGSGAVIELANGTSNLSAITNSDTVTGYGITITNLTLDGHSDSNPSGNHIGIMLSGVGSTNRIGGTISNLNISRFASAGVRLTATQAVAVSGATISDNSIGILVNNASQNNTVTQNIFVNNTTQATYLSGVANNVVTSNQYINNGGSTLNNAIYLLSSDSNTITNNTIRDISATIANYAINISDSGSDTNYLAGNIINNGSINDLGADTIYAGQVNAVGNFILQPTGTIDLMRNTTVAGDLFATGTVLSPSVDRADPGTLTLGSTNATNIIIGKSTGNIETTVLGTALFKPTSGNDSTTAFQIQSANSSPMFTVDSTNQIITFGDPSSSNKLVISTATGQLTKYGTARNVKSITLTPEFAGAVLDAQSDSTCTSASNGTMTAGLDSVGRTNYYNWTSTQGTNQCYNVVIQVPIPAGFSGWQSNSIMMKTSNTSTSAYGISIIDSNGNADSNYSASYAAPGTLGTDWSNIATSSLSGTYAAGTTMTIKIRMSARNNANLQLGNITLNYYNNN